MERRSANRIEWKRVLERQFDVVHIESAEFTGYATRLVLSRLSEPFYRNVLGHWLCLADSGYCWLQHFPEGAHHTVTTMVDTSGNVVQWYIDICATHGIDDDGVPWFDDLYLDIVLLPSGRSALLDQDELETAHIGKTVTQAQYDLAWGEARTLLRNIGNNAMPLLGLTTSHLRYYFPV
jgi:uncharacterized protein